MRCKDRRAQAGDLLIQSTGLTPSVVPSVVLRARGAIGVIQGQQFVRLNVATY
jgi:hypothetical protein